AARRHEQPRQDDEREALPAGQQGEDDDEIEEDWKLELVLERIADLGDARWPVALAERDVARMNDAASHRADTDRARPDEERQGQRDLQEHRAEDDGGTHGLKLLLGPRP